MTPKRITYEVRDGGPAPGPGDILESSRSTYLVLECRAISTRDGTRKFALSVVNVDRDTKGTRFSLVWNKRERSRDAATR